MYLDHLIIILKTIMIGFRRLTPKKENYWVVQETTFHMAGIKSRRGSMYDSLSPNDDD